MIYTIRTLDGVYRAGPYFDRDLALITSEYLPGTYVELTF